MMWPVNEAYIHLFKGAFEFMSSIYLLCEGNEPSCPFSPTDTCLWMHLGLLDRMEARPGLFQKDPTSGYI